MCFIAGVQEGVRIALDCCISTPIDITDVFYYRSTGGGEDSPGLLYIHSY
jgi:hypothetical protein